MKYSNPKCHHHNALLIIAICIINLHAAIPKSNYILNPHKVNLSYIARIFYQPKNSNAFHAPLIYLVKYKNRTNKSPITKYGRFLFITKVQMKQVISLLNQFEATWAWRQSNIAQWPRPSKFIRATGMMDILVVSVNGTARADIAPDEVCYFMNSLYPIFKSNSRVLFWTQLYGNGFNCNAHINKEYDRYFYHDSGLNDQAAYSDIFVRLNKNINKK